MRAWLLDTLDTVSLWLDRIEAALGRCRDGLKLSPEEMAQRAESCDEPCPACGKTEGLHVNTDSLAPVLACNNCGERLELMP